MVAEEGLVNYHLNVNKKRKRERHMKKIGFFVGSLRKDSYTLKVAKKLNELLPEGFEGELVEIRDLPHYNEDLEANVPETWANFRDKVKGFDGFFFLTPEYNRTFPSALKNALDVGSRPYGASVWGQKPAAVVSVSPGAIGGFGANHHLRQALVFLDVPVMAQPEAYIGGVMQTIDENGVHAESLLGFLQVIVDAYVEFFTHFA